jgi:hypothetical protein
MAGASVSTWRRRPVSVKLGLGPALGAHGHPDGLGGRLDGHDVHGGPPGRRALSSARPPRRRGPPSGRGPLRRSAMLSVGPSPVGRGRARQA